MLSSARALTGYRVRRDGDCEGYYSTEDHHVGQIEVQGFTHANLDPDGRPMVAEYLAYLAQHPYTAHRVMRKLALRFVFAPSHPQRLAEVGDLHCDVDVTFAVQALVRRHRALDERDAFVGSTQLHERTTECRRTRCRRLHHIRRPFQRGQRRDRRDASRSWSDDPRRGDQVRVGRSRA